MKKDRLLIKGAITIVDKKSGKVLFENHNIVTQLGLNEIAKFIAGSGGTAPTVIKVGNSNTQPSIQDTDLAGTVLGSKNIVSAVATANTVKFEADFEAGEGSGTWEEIGLYTPENILWSRALTGTYTKKASDEFRVFWTYVVNLGTE